MERMKIRVQREEQELLKAGVARMVSEEESGMPIAPVGSRHRWRPKPEELCLY